MTSSGDRSARIEELEKQICSLKRELEEKSNEIQQLMKPLNHLPSNGEDLSREEIIRYSRQMIVPAVGVDGQKKLKKGTVLVVGCGGLGCPAAQYLAGCGIGRLGLVDYDVVEESNLHRQLLHSELTIGVPKVDSLAQALLRVNSKLQVDKYQTLLTSGNALDIVKKYDVVIDASDNVATRYLVNDACVLTRKPLVSGSAVGLEAQLTVYNFEGGPCYRCLFSSPPPPETVSNCSDVGVVGPVPGSIGVLQALQAIHILTGKGRVLSQRLLLFDGEETVFRTIKLRGKSESCAACGKTPTIKELIDYEQFCGAPANDKDQSLTEIDSSKRISPQTLKDVMLSQAPHLLIDVRSPIEFQMCRLPGSINIPLKNLEKASAQNSLRDQWNALLDNGSDKAQVYVVCRRGNDSQLGVKLIESILSCPVYDVVGGLHAWSRQVDPTFPPY